MMLLINRLNVFFLRSQFYGSSTSMRCCSTIERQKVMLSPSITNFFQFRRIRTKGSRIESDEKDKSFAKQNNEKDEFSKQFEKVETEFKKKMQEYAKQQKVDPKLVKAYAKKIDVKKVAKTVFIVWTIFGLFIIFTVVNFIAYGYNSKTQYDDQFKTPHISFEIFLKKYLPTGEVQRIIHFAFRKKAIVFLHENAIIDGQETYNRSVVIDLDQVKLRDPFIFRDEVRKAEKELGIEMKDGVLIENFQEKSMFGTIELIVGLAILAWLSYQYGRLARKSFDAWKKNK